MQRAKDQIEYYLSGSNLENDSEININWSYEKTKTWNIFIKEPESYILLDQILWDDFSLNSLLWENTF